MAGDYIGLSIRKEDFVKRESAIKNAMKSLSKYAEFVDFCDNKTSIPGLDKPNLWKAGLIEARIYINESSPEINNCIREAKSKIEELTHSVITVISSGNEEEVKHFLMDANNNLEDAHLYRYC